MKTIQLSNYGYQAIRAAYPLNLGKGLFAGISIHTIVFGLVVIFQPMVSELAPIKNIVIHFRQGSDPVPIGRIPRTSYENTDGNGPIEIIEKTFDAPIVNEDPVSPEIGELGSNSGKFGNAPTGELTVSIEPFEAQADTFTIVEIPPVPISQPKAEYPDLLRQTAREGRVFIKAMVNENGDVSAVAFVSGEELFYESAKESALKTKFRPAINGGIPVKVWVTMPFHFRLK